ncbi:replicative helicase loader/inhibitor [Acetobacterium wieringae]|uniref:Uncharacterized protein n=1 Tax=Acetobacterium wieringae TaxID=52694 RepID=A0A1F2PCE8_9FIRM|nr:replicative helicase loader/inhibitor [Acetobacterium wieringae]OFV68923.1 hypothetical protein ACWI_36140 [Acetobacterium wieringae]
MNHAETHDFLEEMQGCFPRISSKATAIETWQEILEKVPYETCHKAYIKFLKAGETREPKPGDILALARTLYKVTQIESVACDICKGSGMLMLIDPDGHESVGRCSCENGKKYPGFPIVKLDFYRYNQMGRIETTYGA